MFSNNFQVKEIKKIWIEKEDFKVFLLSDDWASEEKYLKDSTRVPLHLVTQIVAQYTNDMHTEKENRETGKKINIYISLKNIFKAI